MGCCSTWKTCRRSSNDVSCCFIISPELSRGNLCELPPPLLSPRCCPPPVRSRSRCWPTRPTARPSGISQSLCRAPGIVRVRRSLGGEKVAYPEYRWLGPGGLVSFVNPSATRDLDVDCTVRGFASKSGNAQILHHADMNAFNGFDNPDVLVPQPHQLVVEGSRLRLTAFNRRRYRDGSITLVWGTSYRWQRPRLPARHKPPRGDSTDWNRSN